MKQLTSFLVLSVNGMDRISYTYDEIDPETGDLVSTNNKESFFAVDDEVKAGIAAIRDHISENRLAD